jgi:hypothetical protein
MRAECATNASAAAGEGKDTETGQEDLGNPGQQEGKQRPPVGAKSAAPQTAGADGPRIRADEATGFP